MLPKIPVLIEVSYKEYMKNIHNDKVQYHRQFVIPNEIITPEEVFEFVNSNLNNVHNTDINKYYKSVGIITDSQTEEEENKLLNLAINN